MPRWASRITLEITGVRVERVQDIGESDAIAEGIEKHESGHAWKDYGHDKEPHLKMTATGSYRTLWDSINSKRGFGWDVNPWVFVLEFTKL